MNLSRQQALLLYALRRVNNGIHSHACRAHLRIGNPGQRVTELRELGCHITSTVERRGRSHGCRYRLIELPEEQLQLEEAA